MSELFFLSLHNQLDDDDDDSSVEGNQEEEDRDSDFHPEFLDPSSPFFVPATFSDFAFSTDSLQRSDSDDSGSHFSHPLPRDLFHPVAADHHGGTYHHSVGRFNPRGDFSDSVGDGRSGEEDHEIDESDWGGLRVIGFDSESESDRIETVDPNLSALCWDSLHLDDDGDGDGMVGTITECNNNQESNGDDFEWEEVDGRMDDREVLTIEVDGEDDVDLHYGIQDNVLQEVNEREEDEEEEIGVARNVDWEVLLAVSNLAQNPLELSHEDVESYVADEEEHGPGEFVYTNEYEVLFGQFIEHDSALKASPPAAKSAVERLPTVFLTMEDVAKNNCLCAVCKDEISLKEGAKRLPCAHHYHAGCILPWLCIHNTCPLCRYELPTDDVEYESWKARRASRGSGEAAGEESHTGYDFEILA